MTSVPDANQITAEYLKVRAHQEALSRLVLTTDDPDLALFLQRLLATVVPSPEDGGLAPSAAQDRE